MVLQIHKKRNGQNNCPTRPTNYFLAKKISKEDTEIYILAGSNYSRYLEKMLIDEGYTVINVLKGKGGIGNQMGWLKDELK